MSSNYKPVKGRIKEFREQFKNHSLISKILTITNEEVVMKAIIKDPDGKTIATGHAREVKGITKTNDSLSKGINQTSMLENCETSAWGRALANLGIGIEGGIASIDEIEFSKQRADMSDAEKNILNPNAIIEKDG